jgi:hypothetical protein
MSRVGFVSSRSQQEFEIMSFRSSCIGCIIVFFAFCSHRAQSAIVPFTEDFASNSSNWFNPAGTAPVDWVSSGGPDGGSYVSTTFNFVNQTPGLPIPNNAVNLFRAQDEFNSSNHAFEGDWVGGGVTQFSFWVRHDAPAATHFFARFAPPTNFPGWAAVAFTPVAPNQWTHISFDIAFGNPALFYEGPPPTRAQFNQVFSNIGHVQVGAFGGAMAGSDQIVAFDLDQPSIIPTPASLALLGLACVLRRRRRARR